MFVTPSLVDASCDGHDTHTKNYVRHSNPPPPPENDYCEFLPKNQHQRHAHARLPTGHPESLMGMTTRMILHGVDEEQAHALPLEQGSSRLSFEFLPVDIVLPDNSDPDSISLHDQNHHHHHQHQQQLLLQESDLEDDFLHEGLKDVIFFENQQRRQQLLLHEGNLEDDFLDEGLKNDILFKNNPMAALNCAEEEDCMAAPPLGHTSTSSNNARVISSTWLSPTPLNIPDCHLTVAQVSDQLAQSGLFRLNKTRCPVSSSPSSTTTTITSSNSSVTVAPSRYPTCATTTTADEQLPEIPMPHPNVISLETRQEGHDPTKKKRKFGQQEDNHSEEEALTNSSPRLRSFQNDMWSTRYAELVQYRKRYGHCLVPHNFYENIPLARWVKRQRYQYTVLMKGQRSTLTQDLPLKLWQ